MSSRFAAALCAFVALAAMALGPALAHEGHEEEGAPPAPAEIGPRAVATSPTVELVAIPDGRQLVIYLDHFATNAPIEAEQVEVRTPDGVRIVEAASDGSYRLDAPWLASPRHRRLTVKVKASGLTQTLALDLDPPPSAGGAATPDAAIGQLAEAGVSAGHRGTAGAIAAGFLLGLATILLLRSRKVLPAFAVLAAMLTMLVGSPITAHEGHDEQRQEVRGSARLDRSTVFEPARRMVDGSVFMPKPTQHLLAVRTAIAVDARHRRGLELPGRVIADPNASGIVQSSVGGRLSPPPGGFPNLGTRVGKGDVLATVTPPVQAVDASDMRQTQGDLDQQIAIVGRRVARYEKLAPNGAVAQTALDDARAELAGLKDRRAALDRIRTQSEDLLAPVDGIVAERAAVAGQMANPGTVVFRIVNPDRLYVEALSFEPPEPQSNASARLADGRSLALAYRGAGLTDRAQAVPVQFAITGGAAGLRLGQFVTVLAPMGGAISGLALPRSSIVRSEQGVVVYEHVSAERFVPRTVTIVPLDAETVMVASGLSPGGRIVTEGAELLDQVR